MRAGGFTYSLNVLHGGLEIKINNLTLKLDPDPELDMDLDPHLPKMLDPDPH